jgi:hypothetical protein
VRRREQPPKYNEQSFSGFGKNGKGTSSTRVARP